MMQFTEAVKLALQSLWGNKMRTVLTLIGVVMGVASVIMVITHGERREHVCAHEALEPRRGRVYGFAGAERDHGSAGVLQVSKAQDHSN